MQISNNLVNQNAIKVCSVLKSAGYKAYLVGGCVRDMLLNIKPKDWDITTDALPDKIIELFPKTYPTGIKHGTITVSMNDELFEVTTFRIEGEYKDGRRPEEVFFISNIEQDLSRRDLTINAIAFDPITDTIIDPFDGRSDLNDWIIRAVGDPSQRFREDGLRIMRVARFAARFNYAIDRNTFNEMSKNLETLKKVSKERIKEELCKTLLASHEVHGLKILYDTGALQLVCPLLKNQFNYRNKCIGDLETKIAYLYAYHNLKDINNELLNLKFSNKEVKRVLFILNIAEKYNEFVSNYTSLSYKKFMAYIKNNTPDTWEYSLDQFIKLYAAMGYSIIEVIAKYQSEIVFARNEMKINGNDLMDIGITAGPDLKKILDSCYQLIIEKPEYNERYRLLEFIANK